MNYSPEEQAENRALWIEALESGDYAQTKSQLKYEDTYCCLGVACDISELGIWEYDDDLGMEGYRIANEFREYEVLPEPVMNWLGLRDDAGAALYGVSLVSLNDSGHTFKEIAQKLRDNEEYFYKED